jgi:hypothetical protein
LEKLWQVSIENDFSETYLVIVSNYNNFSCSSVYDRIPEEKTTTCSHTDFSKNKNVLHDPSIIDEFISAKIPDKGTDPLRYAVVENYMINGPCGDLNRNSVCMESNKCTKYFPKKFNSKTTVDKEGILVYRRRDVGKHIKKVK